MNPATDDSEEALQKFGREVLRLLALYRHAQATMSNQSLIDFNIQFTLVDALAQVAVLPVTRVESSTDRPRSPGGF